MENLCVLNNIYFFGLFFVLNRGSFFINKLTKSLGFNKVNNFLKKNQISSQAKFSLLSAMISGSKSIGTTNTPLHMTTNRPSSYFCSQNDSTSTLETTPKEYNSLLEEISDSVHEVSSDLFIVIMLQDLDSSQKKLLQEKLQQSLARMYNLIDENFALVLNSPVVVQVISEMILNLEKISPKALQQLPKLKSLTKKSKYPVFNQTSNE